MRSSLVAISPERPDLSLSTAEKNELAVAVSSDADNRVVTSFRLSRAALVTEHQLFRDVRETAANYKELS
jgi:peroxiredoxin